MHFKQYLNDQICDQLSKRKNAFEKEDQKVEIAAIFFGYDNANLIN